MKKKILSVIWMLTCTALALWTFAIGVYKLIHVDVIDAGFFFGLAIFLAIAIALNANDLLCLMKTGRDSEQERKRKKFLRILNAMSDEDLKDLADKVERLKAVRHVAD